jgi:hypothetical protein
VVAIIALVVATAGTATAATKVLIKSSAQVRNGALDAKDLSAVARKSLQGNRGPTGPAGAAGPAGATGAAGAAGPAGARGPSPERSSAPFISTRPRVAPASPPTRPSRSRGR